MSGTRLSGTAAPDAWRRFFHEPEVAQGFLMAFDVPSRSVYAGRSETECMYSHLRVDGRRMSFFSYPFLHPRSPLAPRRRGAAAQAEPRYLLSELRERDVVVGSSAPGSELARAVEEEARSAELVFLNTYCVPVTIGEDVDALAARVRSEVRVPVVSLDLSARLKGSRSQNTGDLGVVLRTVFESCHGRLERAGGARRPRSVNLVDYPADYVACELEPLLESLGVSVNAALLPDVDLGEVRRWFDAGVQAVAEDHPRSAAHEFLFRGLPLQTVRTPQPYGPEASKGCAWAVAGACGVARADFDRAWARHWKPLRARWQAARTRAKGRAVAFVADDGPALEERSRFLGVPVLAFLREAGFGAAVIEPAAFSTPAELARLLREGRFSAVYSDVFCDRRVTAAGKAPVCLREFRAGALGAVLCAEGLAAACEASFYGRWRDHLASPLEERR